jgi:hypothetical protein
MGVAEIFDRCKNLRKVLVVGRGTLPGSAIALRSDNGQQTGFRIAGKLADVGVTSHRCTPVFNGRDHTRSGSIN